MTRCYPVLVWSRLWASLWGAFIGAGACYLILRVRPRARSRARNTGIDEAPAMTEAPALKSYDGWTVPVFIPHRDFISAASTTELVRERLRASGLPDEEGVIVDTWDDIERNGRWYIWRREGGRVSEAQHEAPPHNQPLP